jgi:hypothetical protein
MKRPVCIVCLVAAIAPALVACAQSARLRTGPDRPSASVYRMDFHLSAKDPSAPAATSNAYSMLLAENRTGEINVGSNVFVSAQARADVGLKLRCEYRSVGDDVMVQTETQMSTNEGPSIRKFSARSEALLTPGQSTVVASLDDPTDHKRYEVTVMATRIR